MENVNSGFKNLFKKLNDNLSLILLIPTLLGGIWQIQKLFAIDFNLIRYFSITQLIPDGILILIYLIICLFGIIPIVILTSFFYVKINEKNKLIESTNTDIENIQNKTKTTLSEDFDALIEVYRHKSKKYELTKELISFKFKKFYYVFIINIIICFLLIVLDYFIIKKYDFRDSIYFINYLSYIYIYNKFFDSTNQLLNKGLNFIKYDFGDIVFLFFIFLLPFFFLSGINKITNGFYTNENNTALILDFKKSNPNSDFEILYLNDSYIFVNEKCNDSLKTEKIKIYPFEDTLEILKKK